MSSYLVLARKYRPSNFSQLVGQDFLVRTLSNSIKNNRMHHGYMLHGIRGIGKTTTARIIAKSINCLDENSVKKGDCCCVCENCRLISSSHHQDVVEIDAASNTNVEGMRNLIDSVAYSPVAARFKIYIIDEIHMLSNQAFNALLKTLEEPPAHVKFIFATTEIRSVPQTILSRCQRFDLRRLDEQEIFGHLSNIMKRENFEADDRALRLIARSSEGSVRDSLSILDQALSSNNHQKFLSAELLEKMLGVSDCFKIIELLENLLTGNFSLAQKTFFELFGICSNAVQIANDLLEIIYSLSCCLLVDGYQLESFSKEQAKKMLEIAKKVEISSLARIWQIVSKSIPDIKSAASARMAFEMLMIRICCLVAIPDLKQALVDLNSMQQGGRLVENLELGIQDSPLTSLQSKNGNNLDQGDKIKSGDTSYNSLVYEIIRNFEGSKICS